MRKRDVLIKQESWSKLFGVFYEKGKEAYKVMRCCRNWPSVLLSLTGGHIAVMRRLLPKQFTLITRSGAILRAPDSRAPRYPVIEVLVDDAYRLDELPWNATRSHGLRVLDVGAHVGSFTVAIAARYPNAQIVSYEPSPTTFAYLEMNIRANGLESRVSGRQVAVGATTGNAHLHESEVGSALSTLVAAMASDDTSAIAVDVVAIAAAISTSRGPELVKLDCEGSEYGIILDSDPLVWKGVSCLLLEYHPVPGHSWEQLKDRLQSFGLGCSWHKESATENLGMAMFLRI